MRPLGIYLIGISIYNLYILKMIHFLMILVDFWRFFLNANGRTYGWTHGRTYGRTHGWTDIRTDRPAYRTHLKRQTDEKKEVSLWRAYTKALSRENYKTKEYHRSPFKVCDQIQFSINWVFVVAITL